MGLFGKKKKSKYTEEEQKYLKRLSISGLMVLGPVGWIAGKTMGKWMLKEKKKWKKRKMKRR